MPDCEQAWLGGLDDANHIKLQADHMLQSHVLVILKMQQAQRVCHVMGVYLYNIYQV
jgi:hypothetical protein